MNNKSKKILTEISAGELFDKISILEIKHKKIKNKSSKKEIEKEYYILKKVLKKNLKINRKIRKLFTKLKKINLQLWNIEDKIRFCEKNKNFGKNFILLARKVYFTNDERAKIKREINVISGSNIKEIKEYISY